MRRGFALGALAAPAALAAALAAGDAAAEPRPLGDQAGDWRAFAAETEGRRLCYAASLPVEETGADPERGASYLTVAFWPEEGRMGEVSLVAGYTYREGSSVRVEVDLGSRGLRFFSLIPQGGRAWAADVQADAALVQALRSGARMTVTGVPARGTETVDLYSLAGSAQAIADAADACRP